MNISNLTPIAQLPSSTEWSSFAPMRDNNSPYTLWKKTRDVVERSNKLSELANQTSRDLKRLESVSGQTDLGFFPFKIYSLANIFRPLNWPSSSFSWRIVRIRAGLVLTNVVSTGSYVDGTDTMDDYAYGNFLPSSTGDYDIEVPLSTPQYWFWIEASGSVSQISQSIASGSTSYFVRYSATPQIADNIGNPNGWFGWPNSSNSSTNVSSSTPMSYIPIGYVDTNTSGSQNIAYVRQFLNTDVLASGGQSSPSTAEFYIQALDDDCFYAIESGSTTWTTIAKPFELRRSTWQGLSNGVGTASWATGIHYFTYAGNVTGSFENQLRMVTTVDPASGSNYYQGNNYLISGSYSTTSSVWPPYLVGQPIIAVQTSNNITIYGSGSLTWPGTASSVQWMDINNDARRWMNQIPICFAGSPVGFVLMDDNPFINGFN